MNTVNRERWASLSLAEQMANIGSEVGRSAKWLTKNKPDLAEGAFNRATELMDLTLDYGRQVSPGRDALLKELGMARLYYTESYQRRDQDSLSYLEKYFCQFAAIFRPH